MVLAWGLQLAALATGFSPVGPAAYDEAQFHTPTILAFAEQLPAPNLREYDVATAPAHHLLLSMVQRLADPPLPVLRFLSGQTTVLLLALTSWWLARRTGPAWGLAGPAALLASSYIAPQLILTLPEGSAWLLVAAILGVGLGARRATLTAVITAALLAALLVCFRQLHLWTVVVAWMIAWLGPEPDSPSNGQTDRLVPALSEFRMSERLPRVLAAALTTLPAFAIASALFVLWQGFVPPGFQVGQTEIEGANGHNGLNPATPALFFAAAGAILPFLITPALDALARRPELRPAALRLAFMGAGVGMLASTLVPSDFDKLAGRWTGLWNTARAFPVLADRSLFIVALATLGGSCLGMALACVRSRDRLIILGVLAAFLAAQSVNLQAWMRYVEPMVLIVGLAIAGQTARGLGKPATWTVLGPLALALIAGIRTIGSLIG